MTEPSRAFLPDDFLPAASDAGEAERLSRPSPGFWRETALRLRRDRVAVACLALLALIALGAVFCPLLTPFDYAEQNVAFANRPFFSPDPDTGAPHLFGTDSMGRDLFVRLWYGARVSLTVALAAALVDGLIGVVYGGLAGYFGGRVDNVMMRLLEVVSGVPYLIVVLLLMAVLPRGVFTLIVAYCLVGWTGMARLVRGQVAGLMRQEFMAAARVMGAGPWRAMVRHLLPNLLGVILVNITLDIPGVIFTEAFLSLLGLGIPPPYPSWGILANEGIAAFQTHPAQLVLPALFICLTMLALNLLGDHLQEVLDPKLRRPLSVGKAARHSKS